MNTGDSKRRRRSSSPMMATPCPGPSQRQEEPYRRLDPLPNLSQELIPSASFDNLPVEIMLHIFSYLQHGDLLDARVTCQRWNNLITNWRVFMDKVSFQWSNRLGSIFVLIGSNTPWKTIVAQSQIFLQTAAEDYIPLNIPIPNALNSLILRDCVFTWTWMKDTTRTLTQLEHLSLIKCSRVAEDEDEGWFQTPAQVAGFLESRRRLKSLTLNVSDLSELNFLCRQFTCGPGEASALIALEISIDYAVLSRNAVSDQLTHFQFSKNFPKLIKSCSSTLKSLKVYTSFTLASSFFRSLSELGQANLDLHTFHYQWIDADRFTYTITAGTGETLFNDFLRSQVNLKSVGVPRTGRFTRISVNLAGYEDIDIGICNDTLTTRLLTGNIPLKTIKIGINHTSEPFSIGVRADQAQPTVYPNLIGLSIHGLGYGSLYSHIDLMLASFPNLDSLIVTGSGSRFGMGFTDENVQSIIRHLPNLRILDILTCDSLSDQGVVGISSIDSVRLWESRSIYMEQSLEVLGYATEGPPLSSLKNLREVTFRSIASSITDVGIFYGFNFKNLKKLNIVCGFEVSDWGLMQVAKLNPNLEHCSVVTASSTITAAGKTVFQSLLPRARRHISVVAPEPRPDSDSSSISVSSISSSSDNSEGEGE